MAVIPDGPGLIARVGAALRYAVTGNAPDGWFGPMQPMTPQAPPEVRGRQWDYPYGMNIQFTPRGQEVVGFKALKRLATHPVVQMLIQRQIDKVVSQDWQIKPRLGEKFAEDTQTKAIFDFLQSPDKEHDFAQWLSAVLDQNLTIDAVTIYAHPTRAGDLYALQVLDGAQFKPLVDLGGRRPMAPDAAYQQVIKGLPAVNYTQDELVYFPARFRADHLYGYCYDAETEIMTRSRGWTKFQDLLPDEEVATRSKAGRFEWQIPSRIIRHDWNGPMCHFHSRSMDLMVTPEHRMLVTTLPGKIGRRAGKSEVVITAAQLAEHNHREIKIPVTSFWEGEEVGEQVFSVAESGDTIEVVRVANGRAQTYARRRVPPQPVVLSGDDFCALMGAYIAEGNKRHQGGIEVAQRPFSKGYALYKPLFDRIGGSYNGRAFVITRRALNNYFEQFGLAHDKFVPDCIRNATPRQIQIFLDFYLAGDGYFASNSNASGRGSHPNKVACATTVSRKLADQLTELAQKIGASASVSTRPAKRQAFFGGRYYSDCRESYVVNFRHSKAMSVNSELTHYHGSIHCVEVGNGIVYVRRNGKPAWCGNSRLEQAKDLVEMAISRLRSQKGYFDFGNIGDGYFTVPDNYTPDQAMSLEARWNQWMQGDVALRRSAPMMPAGTNWNPTKVDILADQFDEFIIRLLCFPFGVAPAPFLKQTGLGKGSADTEHEAAEEGGVAPLMNYVERLMSLIIGKWFGRPDLEFAFSDDREFDPHTAAQIDDINLKNGSRTINQVRDTRGEPPLEGGDKAMIYTASGPVLVTDAANPPEPVAVMPPAPVVENVPPAPKAEKTAPMAKAVDAMAREHLTLVVAAYLAAKGKEISAEIADKLTKAASEDNSARIDAAIDSVDWAWSDLPDDVQPILAGIAVASGAQAASSLGLFDAETLKRVTARATAYAKDRSAELVGMKWVDGELVTNPAAEWAISETTRTVLRNLITKAMEDGASNAQLAKAIAEDDAFGAARASMIARTETALADVRGAAAGWLETGLVSSARFDASPDCCEECQAEDGKVVELSEPDDLDLPHPDCRCGWSAILNDENQAAD